MYEDIDAPSVVTVLLYQLKYADAVSSGVILGEYNCEMLRDRFLPHRKTWAKKNSRGNGGCFAAASPTLDE